MWKQERWSIPQIKQKLNKNTLNRKSKKVRRYSVHMTHDPKPVQWIGGLAMTGTESNLHTVHLVTAASVARISVNIHS